MASHEEPAYFVKARAEGRTVVKDPPKFDLDTYIANYKGRTKFDRLYLIGTSSSFLYSEALKGAIAEAKRGVDVKQYEAAVTALHDIAPNDPDSKVDVGWVDRMTKHVKAETDRLELELKGYKNNLIKESIRMGYDDIGLHYHRIGDLPNATKSYARMRDFCTTPSHIAIMSFRIINVSVDQGLWLAVQSNAQKIRSLAQKPADAEKNKAKLSAALGLAHLASGNYKDAATSFINTDQRMLQARFDHPNDEEAYNEIITPNDIAVYGGICALASMTRNELQTGVLGNSSFRNYLELEPHIRRAISFFVSSKYSSCLSILESYKTDYLLDIHLQRHVPELYFQIRSKAIIQYFIPFSCVTLAALSAAFHTPEEQIEQELFDMIDRGSLDARIDLEDRLLVAKKVDERQKVHADALATSRGYARTCQQRILRMEIIGAGLEVKGSKSQGGMGMGMGVGLGGSQPGYSGTAGDIFSPSGKGRSLRSGGGF